jgi:hypothetical protein
MTVISGRPHLFLKEIAGGGADVDQFHESIAPPNGGSGVHI